MLMSLMLVNRRFLRKETCLEIVCRDVRTSEYMRYSDSQMYREKNSFLENIDQHAIFVAVFDDKQCYFRGRKII